MHETPAVDYRGHPMFHTQFCCTELPTAAKKGIPIDMCTIIQGKTLSVFAHHETLDVSRKDYSQKKKKAEIVCLGRGSLCLCSPDVYTTARRLETDAA